MRPSKHVTGAAWLTAAEPAKQAAGVVQPAVPQARVSEGHPAAATTTQSAQLLLVEATRSILQALKRHHQEKFDSQATTSAGAAGARPRALAVVLTRLRERRKKERDWSQHYSTCVTYNELHTARITYIANAASSLPACCESTSSSTRRSTRACAGAWCGGCVGGGC